MRKIISRPAPSPAATSSQAVAATPAAVTREAPVVSAQQDEAIAADKMAAVVMRRAYGSETAATAAHSRAPTDVGRIRRAVSPDLEEELEEEAEEVGGEVASRLGLSLTRTGPIPVVEGSEQESEELGEQALMDPSALKIRAMYDRLTDAGIEEHEIGDILDLYAEHLAKGGSVEEFMDWIRSRYLGKARPRGSSGRGSKVKAAQKPPPKPGEKPSGKRAGKGAGKGAGKSAGKGSGKVAGTAAAKVVAPTGVKAGGKASPKAEPKGKIAPRTEK